MIGNFPANLNFNRLFLKLNRFSPIIVGVRASACRKPKGQQIISGNSLDRRTAAELQVTYIPGTLTPDHCHALQIKLASPAYCHWVTVTYLLMSVEVKVYT